jgi:hypothetical protein
MCALLHPVPHGSIEGFLVAVDVIETLSAEKWEKDQYTWSMKEGTRLSCCENGRQFTQCTSA